LVSAIVLTSSPAVVGGRRRGVDQVDVAFDGVLLAQGILDESAGLLGFVGIELGLIARGHRVGKLLVQHGGAGVGRRLAGTVIGSLLGGQITVFLGRVVSVTPCLSL
jgi:hypothetical protein